MMLAAPWLMRALAPGLDPQYFRTAVKILRILALSTVAAGVAAVHCALLYTRPPIRRRPRFTRPRSMSSRSRARWRCGSSLGRLRLRHRLYGRRLCAAGHRLVRGAFGAETAKLAPVPTSAGARF